MNWIPLTKTEQLAHLLERSAQVPQAIFKHSPRCSISSMVLSRLERSKTPIDIDFYFLDLIAYRAISNKIAQDFNIMHESPQLLLIRNGLCTYAESHMGINLTDLAEQVM